MLRRIRRKDKLGLTKESSFRFELVKGACIHQLVTDKADKESYVKCSIAVLQALFAGSAGENWFHFYLIP